MKLALSPIETSLFAGILMLNLVAGLRAGDLGPNASTSPGNQPRDIQTGTPSAPAAIPGPMPADSRVPVTQTGATSGVPVKPDPVQQDQEQKIQDIQRQLESPSLSRKKRAQLQKSLTDLKVKTIVTSPNKH